MLPKAWTQWLVRLTETFGFHGNKGKQPYSSMIGRPMATLLLLSMVLPGFEGTAEGAARLNASVSFTDRHIVIRNTGAGVWKQAKISIDGDYAYRAEWVPRGTISIAYAEIVDAAGEAYEPRPGVNPHVRIEVSAADGKPAIFER